MVRGEPQPLGGAPALEHAQHGAEPGGGGGTTVASTSPVSSSS